MAYQVGDKVKAKISVQMGNVNMPKVEAYGTIIQIGPHGYRKLNVSFNGVDEVVLMPQDMEAVKE